MLTRERLDAFKAVGEKHGPILSAEARMAIPELCAEIERCWTQIAELQASEAKRRLMLAKLSSVYQAPPLCGLDLTPDD